MKISQVAPTLGACLLVACSTSSAIRDATQTESAFAGKVYGGHRVPLNDPIPGEPRFRIYHRGATGFTPVAAVRSSAMRRVEDFCNEKHKRPYLIEETMSVPPHLAGNFPRTEFVFSCVQSGYQPTNATNALESENQTDKYDKIRKLKQLLDDGAITRSEYDAEKSKLLNQGPRVH